LSLLAAARFSDLALAVVVKYDEIDEAASEIDNGLVQHHKTNTRRAASTAMTGSLSLRANQRPSSSLFAMLPKLLRIAAPLSI
tara:strand:- start:147 stop:395 length:249 start_codon:yes stop_codon:yes gene_type:complete